MVPRTEQQPVRRFAPSLASGRRTWQETCCRGRPPRGLLGRRFTSAGGGRRGSLHRCGAGHPRDARPWTVKVQAKNSLSVVNLIAGGMMALLMHSMKRMRLTVPGQAGEKILPVCRYGSKHVCKTRCSRFDPSGGKFPEIAQTNSKGWTQPMAKVHPPEVYAVVKRRRPSARLGRTVGGPERKLDAPGSACPLARLGRAASDFRREGRITGFVCPLTFSAAQAHGRR